LAQPTRTERSSTRCGTGSSCPCGVPMGALTASSAAASTTPAPPNTATPRGPWYSTSRRVSTVQH
jgi:hypothetical protein